MTLEVSDSVPFFISYDKHVLESLPRGLGVTPEEQVEEIERRVPQRKITGIKQSCCR
jgi:hypothetical protein